MEIQNLVDEKVAAEILGLAVQTLRNWRCCRRGPRYVKLGRAVRYHLEDLDEFVQESRIRRDGGDR